MSTTTERVGPIEQFVLDHEAPLAWDDPDEVITFARTYDGHLAATRNLLLALEDRIEKATEMVQQMQVHLARAGYYETAETCAAVLDVLRGVSR